MTMTVLHLLKRLGAARSACLGLFAVLLVFTTNLSQAAETKKDFSLAWSVYAGWMPWPYADQSGILKKWADKALCLKIMHERSYKRFWCLNAWYNIPVIIISTLTGTGNFASGSFGEWSQYVIFVFGAFSTALFSKWAVFAIAFAASIRQFGVAFTVCLFAFK
jgi:hypothetical protein